MISIHTDRNSNGDYRVTVANGESLAFFIVNGDPNLGITMKNGVETFVHQVKECLKIVQKPKEGVNK